MKHINEYLLSKNKNKIVDDFRQFETKEEACDFFENKGFEKVVRDGHHHGYDYMISKFLNSDKPIYCTGKFDEDYSEWWVRFGKGGEDEYIFFWAVKETRTRLQSGCYLVCDSNDRTTIKEFKSFEEFKEYVKNYFGWQ